MNPGMLDIVFIVIILIASIRCIIRGFVTEIMSIASMVLSIGCAILFSGIVAKYVERYLGLTNWSQVISFLFVFILVYLLVKIFEGTINKFLEKLKLEKLDRALGLFLGIGEGAVIVIILILLIYFQPFFPSDNFLNGSVIAGIVLKYLPYATELFHIKGGELRV